MTELDGQNRYESKQPETGELKKRGAIGKGLLAFLLTGSVGTALLVYLFFMLIGH